MDGGGDRGLMVGVTDRGWMVEVANRPAGWGKEGGLFSQLAFCVLISPLSGGGSLLVCLLTGDL